MTTSIPPCTCHNKRYDAPVCPAHWGYPNERHDRRMGDDRRAAPPVAPDVFAAQTFMNEVENAG